VPPKIAEVLLFYTSQFFAFKWEGMSGFALIFI